jgi:hypothetical protein
LIGVPDYHVVTEGLAAHAVTLDGVAKTLHGSTGVFSAAADGAADTMAAAALHEATARWTRATDEFAGAVHSLGVAVVAAAECYAVTDATVMPE